MSDTRKRQPRGVPIGGEFAANEHDEASAGLSPVSAPEVEVLAEDIEWGEKTISDRLLREGFTNGYIEMSRDHYRPQIERMALRRAEAHAPMRAFLAGEPHPTDESFDTMWESSGGLTTPGFSRIDVENNLANITRQRGQGEEMDRVLDVQEAFWKRASETHGRSLGINQSIALSANEEASD